MASVRVDIYEEDEPIPVLTHIAYGKDIYAAWRIISVHSMYDSFLKTALSGKDFQGIRLSVEVTEQK